jgi:hypothetical protein
MKNDLSFLIPSSESARDGASPSFLLALTLKLFLDSVVV